MKQKGLSMNAINKFDEKLNEMLDSEKFRDFAEGKHANQENLTASP